MFVPIAVVVLMSFNDPTSRLIYQFDAFTLDNWLNPCAPTEHVRRGASGASQIGLLATLVATILGTLMAFALVRHRFAGAVGGQPDHLPADGLARDRDGLLAAGALRRLPASAVSSASGRS